MRRQDRVNRSIPVLAGVSDACGGATDKPVTVGVDNPGLVERSIRTKSSPAAGRLVRLASVCATVLMCANLPIEPGRAASVVLPDALNFARAVGFGCDFISGGSLGCDLNGAPGDSSSYSDPYRLADAANSPTGPFASVSGRASAPTDYVYTPGIPGISVSAGAEVIYYAEIVRTLPLPRNLLVPFTINANFQVHASGDPSSNSGALAIAYVIVDGPYASREFGQYACSGGGPSCPALLPIDTNPSPLSTLANSVISVTVHAGGVAVTQTGGVDASFDAVADPVLTIGSGLIPGTNISFRDAFDVVVSPGVTQSLGGGGAPIPEPTPVLLLVTGTLGLVGARWVLGPRSMTA